MYPFSGVRIHFEALSAGRCISVVSTVIEIVSPSFHSDLPKIVASSIGGKKNCHQFHLRSQVFFPEVCSFMFFAFVTCLCLNLNLKDDFKVSLSYFYFDSLSVTQEFFNT